MFGELQELEAQDWVKVRCALDSRPIFLTWTGSVYAFVPNERKKKLFNIVGVNVGRCIEDGNKGWEFTSRELNYYLELTTDELVHKWENPWTGEILPIVHVANNPVQGYFRGAFPARVNGDTTTFALDIFVNYPNPLSGDERFLDYSPNPTYQAAELFKLTVPTQDLQNPEIKSVSQLLVAWDRIGPWLPWMKMGNKPGHLIYSATGMKVERFTDLPELLQQEINTRLPLYKDAPQAPLEQDDMTSWTYFQRHFEAYLSGEQFPIPEPAQS